MADPAPYAFSRAVYRSIAPLLTATGADAAAERLVVLRACEAALERLVADRAYFPQPERAVFRDIRRLFPLRNQAAVAAVLREGMRAAATFLEQREAAVAPSARCAAHTRRGKRCQRRRIGDTQYCPSHRTTTDA